MNCNYSCPKLSSNEPYKNINVVLPSLSRFRALNEVAPNSDRRKKGIVNDAGISGVLSALAAKLVLAAIMVAAKDSGDGCGGGEKMQNEGKGGGGGEKMRRHERPRRHGGPSSLRSLASCMRRSLGLVRSALPSLPLAPRLLNVGCLTDFNGAPRRWPPFVRAHEALSGLGKRRLGAFLPSMAASSLLQILLSLPAPFRTEQAQTSNGALTKLEGASRMQSWRDRILGG